MEYQDCSISYAEKVRIYSEEYLKTCRYVAEVQDPRYFFSKRLYSKLISTSHLLEDLLDFHGAKNNREWFLYRELTACIRHLSLGGYAQQHIANRLKYYPLGNIDDFRAQGEKTLSFINNAIIKLAPRALAEAERLGIQMPDVRFCPKDFPGVIHEELMVQDIDDDEDTHNQNRYIVKVASEFLEVSRAFDQFGFYEPYRYEEMLELVPEKVNEAEMRRFQILMHNTQSAFDTYVVHGGFREGNPKLKELRAHLSVSFHLLQIVGRLLHLFERHIKERGFKDTYKRVQDQLREVVDPELLLDRTINYALFHVNNFLSSGRQVARTLLNEYVEQSAITVGIPQKLGFHSRPSLMVAKIVQHFGGRVELCVGDARFDASSVLDIQWAGGEDPEGKHRAGDLRRRHPGAQGYRGTGECELWRGLHGKGRAASARARLSAVGP